MRNQMNKKKVLMIIDRMMVGGAEQVFEDLVLLMKDRVNLMPLFISDSEKNQLKRISNISDFICLNRTTKYSITKLFELRFILKNYDIVHIHMRHTLKYVNIAALFLKVKLIYHDHDSPRTLNFFDELFLFRLRKPNWFIGVKESTCSWANIYWKLEKCKVSCLVNLPPKQSFVSEISTEKACTMTNKFVLVGNIKPIKNQKFAMDFTTAIQGDLDLICKVQDKTYYADQIQPHLSESQKVFVDIDNAGSVLSEYKFGLCTSISESGPLVILEYFVAGLPFLSYKAGGIADILAKYVPQYFLDNFEIQEWKARYNLLNLNYQRIPKDLIDHVIETEFNREVYAEKLLNIYNQCLDS